MLNYLSMPSKVGLIQAAKYTVVGCSGIFVSMGVLIILKEYLGFLLPLASIFAIELSILNNFVWNERWTFSKPKHPRLNSWKNRLVLFQLVALIGAVINFTMLNVLALYFGIDYRIANLIGIGIAFGWNYTLNKNVTWKDTYEV